MLVRLLANTSAACKAEHVDGDIDGKAWVAGVFDRAAPTYDAVAGAYHDYFGSRLVALAGLRADDAVLDVGRGRGAVLLPAATKVGPSGRVSGIDLSPEMIATPVNVRTRPACAPTSRSWTPNISTSPTARSPSSCAVSGSSSSPVHRRPRSDSAARSPERNARHVDVGRGGPAVAWEAELLADVVVERRAVRRAFDDPDDLAGLLRGAGFVTCASTQSTTR